MKKRNQINCCPREMNSMSIGITGELYVVCDGDDDDDYGVDDVTTQQRSVSK